MPSRKQRRRREKLQRHEWEYVVETDDGEVPVERPEPRERAAGKRGSDARDGTTRDRRGREVTKPTFARTLRRSAIFAPLILIVLYVTGGNELSTAGIILNAVVLLAFFIPFSHMVDVLVYRAFQRRQARQGGGR